MSDSSQFDVQLEEITDYVNRIGDEIVNRNVEGIIETGFQGEEYALTGHNCSHGNHIYVVAGHPALDYFQIYYLLSIKQNVAAQLNTVEKYDIQPDDDVIESIINRSSSEDMDELQFKLYLEIASGDYAVSLTGTDGGALESVEINQKIFPESRSFDIASFNRAVQSTISGGSKARAILANALKISVDAEDPEKTQMRISVPL